MKRSVTDRQAARIQADVQKARESGRRGAIGKTVMKYADKLGVSERTIWKYAA
ncbi:MAG TPA: hypothetical protein VFD92_04545 [Candidatus Binatia bacterium]|nr:hypothetical protein [Candidatus Binatia bacterium]